MAAKQPRRLKETPQPADDWDTRFARFLAERQRADWKGFTWAEAYKRHPELERAKVRAVISGRNFGKSTDTFAEPWRRGMLNAEHKGLFLRNNDTQLKTAVAEFNRNFAGLLRCVGSLVYKLKEERWKNEETGETRAEWKIAEHVGYFASVAQAVNYKGAWTGRGVSFVVYEEFNQQDGLTRGLYPDFINLLSTMIRLNTETVCYMIGNKDTFMSDFFVNWDILPELNHDKDIVYKVGDPNDPDVVLLDVGREWYKAIDVKDTLAYRLAQYDKLTQQYMAGEYMAKTNPLVKNQKHLTADFSPLYVLELEQTQWMVGKIPQGYAVLSPWNAPKAANVRRIALDKLARVSGALMPTPEELNDIAAFVLKGLRTGTLFFDGYDGYNAFALASTVWKRDEEWN